MLREAEEKVARLAEEEDKARADAERVTGEDFMRDQTEYAFIVISDLDNALKAFQGALGLSEVSGALN